jgi:ribonuclease HI
MPGMQRSHRRNQRDIPQLRPFGATLGYRFGDNHDKTNLRRVIVNATMESRSPRTARSTLSPAIEEYDRGYHGYRRWEMRNVVDARKAPMPSQAQERKPQNPPPVRTIPVVDLFTDGACIGNPGPGGWAFILRHRASGKEKEQSGGLRDTTNNRMEMLAVIEGLAALKRRSRVTLHSDSQYVVQGIGQWMANWKRFGWRPTAKSRRTVKNADLWQRMDALVSQHEVAVNWVRGHTGHPDNERCDVLSVKAAESAAKNPNAATDVRVGEDDGLFNPEARPQ